MKGSDAVVMATGLFMIHDCTLVRDSVTATAAAESYRSAAPIFGKYKFTHSGSTYWGRKSAARLRWSRGALINNPLECSTSTASKL